MYEYKGTLGKVGMSGARLLVSTLSVFSRAHTRLALSHL